MNTSRGLKKYTNFLILFFSLLILLYGIYIFTGKNHSDSLMKKIQNNKTNMTLQSTFHHVGIQITLMDKSNTNFHTKLEANINHSGFKLMHRLSQVASNRFVGTIFNLSPNDHVKVRVTLYNLKTHKAHVFHDEINTRSSNIPKSVGNTLHVDVNKGSDINADGSIEKPYATIAQALEFIKPNTTLLIHAGTYHEQIDVPYGDKKSQEGQFVTIRSASDGLVILDGISPTLKKANAWSDEGNNIYSTSVKQSYFVGIDGQRLWRYDDFTRFKNLSLKTNGGFYVDKEIGKLYVKLPNNASPNRHEIQVSTLDYGLQLNNISNLVIRDLTFRGYGAGQFSHAISISEDSKEIWIVNNRFENMETSIWLEGYSENITIMNNDFSDQGINAFTWDNVKEHQWWLERGAVFCSNDGYSGRGLIFYKNTVHDMFDGIKITGKEILNYANNSDVEANIFRHLSDDGIETDGWSSNVRIINNRFENLLSGVSVAPAIGGPTYVIGNIMDNLNNVAGTDYETVAVKFNVSDEPASGEIFVYYNTASTHEKDQAAFSVTNNSAAQGVFLKNNIWVGTAYAFYYWLKTDLAFQQDYDLHFALGDKVILYQGEEYQTIQAYSKHSKTCQHCKIADPLFKNIEAGNYALNADSPARNQAVLIPGINGNYLGSAPDIGALEYVE